MELRIYKPGEAPPRWSVLVYGPTGVGKTWLLASGEKFRSGRMLVVAVESARGLEGFDVDVVDARTLEDLKAVHRYLRDEKHPYVCVGIDSLTQLQKFLFEQFASAEAERREQKDLMAREVISLRGSQDTIRQTNEAVRRIIWAFNSLPISVVYTALDRVFTTEDELGRIEGPGLSPTVSTDVRSYCDVVARMSMKLVDRNGKTEVQRTLWLSPNDTFYTRVRAGKGVEVPDRIVDPTLPKLFAVLNQNRRKEESSHA